MNYEQIKDCVVRVDTTLELVPIHLLETLLGEVEGAPYVDLWALHDIELPHDVDVPGIQCVVHSLMELDTRRYYAVGTLVISNTPAFFFTAGGREGNDHYNYYILDADATKEFIRYLLELSMEKAVTEVVLTETPTDTDIPDLDEMGDIDMVYDGRHWYCDNPDDMWVQLRKD